MGVLSRYGGENLVSAERDLELVGGPLAELIGRRELDLDLGPLRRLLESFQVREPALDLGPFGDAGRDRAMVLLTSPLTTTVDVLLVVAKNSSFFFSCAWREQVPLRSQPRAGGAGPAGSGW